MNLQKYYQLDGNQLSFTRSQASNFAKGVAGDFNPIHDVDAKRFCVPGDLLFAVILKEYGLSQSMVFSFADMVDDKTTLILPDKSASEMTIANNQGKTCLTVNRSGESSDAPQLIDSLTQAYVEFSGLTFPHVLVPLMRDHNVMINTMRPLVIYEQMSITLDQLPQASLSLEQSDPELNLEGKRADVFLNYLLKADGKTVGRGQKQMVLSGLRDFEQEKIDDLIDIYNRTKAEYLTA